MRERGKCVVWRRSTPLRREDKRRPCPYYSGRKNSEKVLNEFFQIGSKQIKTGLVNWSKKIKSKTHFEAITTHPLCISAARMYYLAAVFG